ncbi:MULTISPECIES: M56 family metallopeptidase [unclassified Carboxylicivirga]|uniref:M56 family metallopeptidase n=1 Tax=Carboxylicivirga TaxID=1628153 RepID=UPI003D34A869
MSFLVNYLLESALILGLLTIFYRGVLHYEARFTFNRFYLLASLVVAAVIPFLSISLGRGAQSDAFAGNMLTSVTVYAQNTKAIIVPAVAQSSAFKWLYLIGCGGLFLRLMMGFIRLGGMAGKLQIVRFKGYKVANLPGHFNPFSFFNVVFVNQQRYAHDELEQIMIHELTHVRLRHSWDVLLIELLLIIQWFNPFAWYLHSLLKELHEFQADRQVLDKGYSAKCYKELLLYQATGARLLPVNNFNQSLTKKRFTMMKKDSIQKFIALKPTLAILCMALIVGLFACELDDEKPALTEDEAAIKDAVENTNAQLKAITGPVFFIVEEMPQFPGGEEALRDHIFNSIDYPKAAEKAGVSGRVYVTFIVDKDGQVANSKIARSSGFTILDEEALRVISEMPQWTPGKQKGKTVNVSYTVPINFILNGGEGVKKTEGKKTSFNTPEEKAEFVKKMKDNGFDVQFNDNGTFSLKHNKGKATPLQ